MNKKQGNCYLSTSLRNKGAYSVSMTLEGFGGGDVFFQLLLFSFTWQSLVRLGSCFMGHKNMCATDEGTTGSNRNHTPLLYSCFVAGN